MYYLRSMYLFYDLFTGCLSKCLGIFYLKQCKELSVTRKRLAFIMSLVKKQKTKQTHFASINMQEVL